MVNLAFPIILHHLVYSIEGSNRKVFVILSYMAKQEFIKTKVY